MLYVSLLIHNYFLSHLLILSCLSKSGSWRCCGRGLADKIFLEFQFGNDHLLPLSLSRKIVLAQSKNIIFQTTLGFNVFFFVSKSNSRCSDAALKWYIFLNLFDTRFVASRQKFIPHPLWYLLRYRSDKIQCRRINQACFSARALWVLKYRSHDVDRVKVDGRRAGIYWGESQDINVNNNSLIT